jgi:hypothetical protein
VCISHPFRLCVKANDVDVDNVDVDNALPQVFPDQSISLSKLPDVDNLLSVSQPRWSNSTSFQKIEQVETNQP